MRGRIPADQLLFDPEIEATARKNNSKTKKRKQLAKLRKDQEPSTSTEPSDNQTQLQTTMAGLGGNNEDTNAGFTQFTPRNMSRIGRPAGNERPLEMKTGLVQLMYANPFAGLDHENPYNHLTKFYELCGTAGIQQNEEEMVFLRLFPLTLIGQAKEWFLDQPQTILQNWNELERKFMARYFSDSKFMDYKTAISTFSQAAGETLCEAWERYKSMLRKCPNHGFDARTQIHIFRNGLHQQSKLILDATAGGSLMAKTPTEAIHIIEAMALNDQQSQFNRGPSRKPGIIELGANDALLAQNKLLQQQMDELTKKLNELPKQFKEMQKVNRCDISTNEQQYDQCQQPSEEEVQYINNQQRPYPYQSNFPRPSQNQYANQPWRQDAGPSSSRATQFQNQQQQQYQQPHQFQNQQQQQQQVDKNTKLEDTLNQFIQLSMANYQSTLAHQKNTDAGMKNLEIQVGQLAKQMNELNKGKFSANTVLNPRESCNAICTRSGRVVGREVGKEEEENKKLDQKKSVNEEVEKEDEKNKKSNEQVREEVTRSPPIQRLPYPPNSRVDQERNRKRFIDIFKTLNITMPFSEALDLIPSYNKYMKELLNKKGKLKELNEDEVVKLNGSCSAILQCLPPPKHRSSRRLVLPVSLDNIQSCNALIDSGSTINMMPLSMLKRLGDVDIEPSGMTLQLADKSIKYPQGVAENVAVMVEHLDFLIDFVVVDVPEDKEVPLILGMPFIRKARVAFDVDTKIFKVRKGVDEVHFQVFNDNQCQQRTDVLSLIEEVDFDLGQLFDEHDLSNAVIDTPNHLSNIENTKMPAFENRTSDLDVETHAKKRKIKKNKVKKKKKFAKVREILVFCTTCRKKMLKDEKEPKKKRGVTFSFCLQPP